MQVFADYSAMTYSTSQALLCWSLTANFAKQADEISFRISRSEAENGPWEDLGTVELCEEFLDSTSPQGHPFRTLFYKIAAIRGGEVLEETPPFTFLWETTLEGIEVMRSLTTALRAYSGTRFFHLKKKTLGQSCSCLSQLNGLQGSIFRGNSGTTNCPICFDTQFVGGYYAPVEIYAQVQPTTSVDNLQAKNYSVIAPGSPIIKPNDLLVQAKSNKRLKVLAVNPTERFGMPVRQVLTVEEVPFGNVLQRIPIFEMSDSMSMVPPAFENPTTQGPT